MFWRCIQLVLPFITLVFLLCGSAHADDFHYTNLLIGDRASGMGGAYTAIADDATGLYYNPAGIAFSTGGNLSASVNAYYNNQKTYESVIGGNGWSRRSSSLLPNYFGVVQPVGRFRIGISYAVPDSIMEDQGQTFHDLPLSSAVYVPPGTRISSYTINFNNENNVYQFGPSIAIDLADDFSAGLTLYYYQKKSLWILNQLIKTTNGGYEWTNQYYHLKEEGLRPILGVMWSPLSTVSIGLAVSKIMLLSSDASLQTSYRREGIGFYSSATGTIEYSAISLPDGPTQSTTKRKYPTQVSLGVAWFPSPSLLLSTDLNYFTKVESESVEEVTNIAVGTEYYLSKNWAVRGGAFTNFANTPKVRTGGVNQSEHIDLYGGTVSISSFTRNSSVTLGAGLTYGSGEAQVISDSTSIQTATSEGWMIFLSSSFSY
jgi:long-chain fatty acid transport protein